MKRIAYFGIIFLLTSCHTDRLVNYYEKLFKGTYPNIDGQFKAYVIIPNTGCPGCISNAESFLKDHINELRNVRFILTNIYSLKILRYKLTNEILKNENIIVDIEKKYFAEEFSESIYPLILYLDGNSIIKLECVSPENPNALDDLYKKLKE